MKTVFIAVLIFCGLAVAQRADKQDVAVYMAGEEPQGAQGQGTHRIMGGELAKAISRSEKYSAIDRTEDFLKQLAAEHKYQRSGAVNDEQIRELGKQIGVQLLCISRITPTGDAYYLETRLLDVETAKIQNMTTEKSYLRDTEEKIRVAQKIAAELIDPEKLEKEGKQRQWKKRAILFTGIGLDVLGAGLVGYGLYRNNDVKRYVKDDRVEDAKSATTIRNVAYIAGGALILSGISIHIFF